MSDTNGLEQLRGATIGALSDALHSEQELRDMVAGLRPILAANASDDDVDILLKELIQQLQIDVDLGTAITSEDFVPWLVGRRADIQWTRWKAYKKLLLKQGRPPKVVDKLGLLTDEILDLAGDPKEPGVWARRGLVIGDVQSGKTGTYLGLFNKAADAGYRLIIVLAGSTESLRQQTQERLDESFIGRDTRVYSQKAKGSVPQASNKKLLGIGKIDETVADVQSMTTVMADFRKSSLLASSMTVSESSPAPYVFVLKKNKPVLTAVQEWLGQQAGPSGRLNLPLLLLDDESDYASVNTAGEDSPAAINNAIRGILSKFNRSSYVAFTATPFANIFIDHEHEHDLFPRDYVYSLEAPSNYVGSAAVFGTSTEVLEEGLMDVTDAEGYFPRKHKSHLSVTGLPPSLRLAIRVFFLTTTIRDLRGHQGGRAMLVNVSRFKNVQNQVFNLVEDYVARLKTAVDMHASAYADGTPNQDLSTLEETFNDVFPDVEVDWPDVLAHMWGSVEEVRVQLVNSDRDKALIDKEMLWTKPPRMVAVGGDVLSRGLTLEGLSTSYFFRQAGAFDTLMQMARWFGYREGYQDLTRLWITEDVADHFRFVDEAVRELRDDLADMRAQRLTPSDFGLAVKKHPESLLVTARNKMKAATTFTKAVSLGGRRIETVRIPSDTQSLAKNYDAFHRLLEELGPSDEPANRQSWMAWRAVPKATIAQYLETLSVDEDDPLWRGGNLQRFVGSAKSPSMQQWDVVIAEGKRSGPNTEPKTVAGISFVPPERAVTLSDGGCLRISGRSARLAGTTDVESLNFFSADVREHVKRKFQDARGTNGSRATKIVPETYFYSCLPRPVLMMYPLRAQWKDRIPTGLEHVGGRLVIATKIVIPGKHTEVRNTSTDADYVINTVAQKAWLSRLEWGDDAD